MEFYYGGRACSEGCSESEAFRIDDLLDFSSEEIGAPIGSSKSEEEEDESNHKGGANVVAAFSGDSTVTETEAAAGEVASRPSSATADVVFPAVELCVPTDALEELDWLSGLGDDTFESVPDYFPTEVSVAKKSMPAVRTWLRCRARSKRRTAGGGFSSSSHTVVYLNGFVAAGAGAEASVYSRPPPPPPAKTGSKKGKKTKKEGGEEGFQRRCSHCSVHRTPQWRTGPLGPKTLCNACGVRYKSGRLLPEYRPALSPTFSSDVHSNCHRKVIEIRLQKEGQQQGIVA